MVRLRTAILAFLVVMGCNAILGNEPAVLGEGGGSSSGNASAGSQGAGAASASTNSATPASSSSTSGGAGGACPGITQQASPVTLMAVGKDAGTGAPTPTGGTIADGTYVISAANYYDSPFSDGPISVQFTVTVILGGSRYQQVRNITGLVDDFSTIDGSINFVGSSLSLTATCSTGTPETSAEYSATPTTLKLYVPTSLSTGTVELILGKI